MNVEQQIRKTQKAIVSRFTEMDDPLFTYELLLDTARQLPELPACYRTNEFKVEGCQSQAWLFLAVEEGCLFIQGDSDTLVVRGIISLLAEAFNGRPCASVAQASTTFLEEAGVMDTFDSARRSGIAQIIETIQKYARDHQ